MAANPTPTNDDVLMARLTIMARACAEHGEALGIKSNTGEVMEAALQAAREAKTEVGRLKKQRGDRRKALREADTAGERVLGRCRLRLVMFYGPTFNTPWDAAGFPDRSTQVPESQAKRSSLLTSLAGWFRANPSLESTDMQATAEICDQAHAAYRAARAAILSGKSELRTAVVAKNAAMKKLRKRHRSVIRELTVLLADDDARWRLFGLNIPAHPSMPRPVPSAQAEKIPGGGWLLTWTRARHARRYRVQARRLGEAAFENQVTVKGFQAHLPELPHHPAPEFQIIAANDAGEAAACAVVVMSAPT
ncbi:MAG: hypothetical protein JNG86_06515 [Verrucomicrobiaceae bacterium]|nr:hypothetical protein [Verrucomicrobiaceae bacterium]